MVFGFKGLGSRLASAFKLKKKMTTTRKPLNPQTFMNGLHRFLALKPQPRDWHPARLREELAERRAARTRIEWMSETADVLYTISRANYEGHPIVRLPRFVPRHAVVYAYLWCKYASRWTFYRTAAYLCGCPNWGSVCEVVNPAKDRKVMDVAKRNHIDQLKYVEVCRRLRRVWILLP